MSKRFHVHVHVDDLDRNIGFYSALFGAQPARREADYAKWMLDDPPVNFAISTWGARTGVDHLGIQTEDGAELAAMRERAQAADLAMAVEDEVSCCYARSDKHWITDPQGIAWEHFHTLADVPTFSPQATTAEVTGCCTPGASQAPQVAAKAACCTPRAPQGRAVGVAVRASGGCCGA